jgi:hypothetical protein
MSMLGCLRNQRGDFLPMIESHEHNTNHLRLGDFTVRFRFGRTGQDPPEKQLRLTIAREMSEF